MSNDANTPERLRRVRALFDGAVERDVAERRSWLERETQGDDELRAEVEALIAESESTVERIDGGAIIHALTGSLALEGRRLGAYHVLRRIGAGGMGDVYEAIRDDDQYRKRVALKVVRSGLGSETSLLRFRRERQILANLAHPNIATLLDGGVTPDGRPFLVMEFVEGAPLTNWCNSRRLGIRQRLDLFLQVCAAVSHAHKNLVVHRDLKPANILVTPEGTVKLLDFGIAKLIDEDAIDDGTPVTRAEFRVLTPEYASPEQISGSALTTSSDVYSLGVVLYELLAGRRPFSGLTGPQLEQAVLTSDAQPPSSTVTREVAIERDEPSVDRLARQLRDELDVVALTALRKEPARRYPSVEALADDLRRYLRGFPIAARRDSRRYRLTKFVGRNRGLVVASAVALVAVLSGAAIAFVQARATRVERDHARFEQQRAAQVAAFLQELLGAGDVSWVSPTRIAIPNPTIAQALDSAARRLPRELKTEPLIRASLHQTIGRAYLAQGRIDDARVQLDSAMSIHRGEVGDDNATVATDLYFRAWASVTISLDSTEALMKRAIAMMERHRPDTMEFYVPVTHDLAYLASARGHLADAETLFTRVISLEHERLAPRRALLAITYGSLGLTLWNEGRSDSALTLMGRGVSIFDSLPSADLGEHANALVTYATALVSSGRAAAALPHLLQAKKISERVYGPNAPALVQIGVSLGDAYLATGDTARSDKESLAAIALGERLPPGNEAMRFQAEWTYTRSLRSQHRFEEAERFARRQYALAEKSVTQVPHYWADATFLLGAVLAERGKAREAEGYLLQSYRTANEKLGAQHVRTLRTFPLLVTTYLELGRRQDAERFRSLMPDTMGVRVDSVLRSRQHRSG